MSVLFIVIMMENDELIMDFLMWATHEEDITLCKKGVMAHVEQRIPLSRGRMKQTVIKYLKTLEQ